MPRVQVPLKNPNARSWASNTISCVSRGYPSRGKAAPHARSGTPSRLHIARHRQGLYPGGRDGVQYARARPQAKAARYPARRSEVCPSLEQPRHSTDRPARPSCRGSGLARRASLRSPAVKELAVASADPYLNNLLIDGTMRRGWLIGYQEVSALSRTRSSDGLAGRRRGCGRRRALHLRSRGRAADFRPLA